MHIKANPYSFCQKHTFLLINSLLKWQNSQAHSGISLERAGFSVKPFISLSQPNIVQHHIHCLTRAENIKYRSHTCFVIILLITILSEITSFSYRRDKRNDRGDKKNPTLPLICLTEQIPVSFVDVRCKILHRINFIQLRRGQEI